MTGISDSFIRDKLFEGVIFVSILVAITVMLGISALYAVDTAPPHAGIDVKEVDNHIEVSVTTMGQSNRVTVVTNGTVSGTIRDVSERVRIQKTPNKTKRVQIISDNGRRALLLRELKV